MSYLLYKLKFPNGIHVGANNSLESTEVGIHSDTFYSALYSEYMKIYGDDEMLKISENGEFRVSDLFPFKEIKKETVFYLPKPYVSIDRKINNYLEKDENTVDRKRVKGLGYIPASKLKDYFSFLEIGRNFPEIDENFGKKQLYTKNKISKIGKETELYNVEIFKFNKSSGLYFIMKIPTPTQEIWKEKMENLLESLSLAGIGGKKSAGYGQFLIEEDAMEFDGKDFDIIESEDDAFINKGLYKEERNYLILSSYFPDESEIGKLKKDGNGYKIIRRSGFVNSPYYSEEPQKRKQIYMISSGAILDFKPEGKMVDLKLHGDHSIYRMGKPIIIGVDLWER